MKIIFFGTSKFAVPAFQLLMTMDYRVVVISGPDSVVGRNKTLTPPPVKIAAEKLGVNVLQPRKLNDPEFIAYCLSLNANIGVVASYGKIIPKAIINLFPLGILNIHPSLLPKYRGPSPIQYALLNGDRETGVTIIKIDDQIDHGAIVKQWTVSIKPQEKYNDLHDKLANVGAELLIKTLPDFVAGKIKPYFQDNAKATFTKMITKDVGRINWNETADQIYNQFRAFHLWPGIWTLWQGQLLKITDCLPQKTRSGDHLTGSVFRQDTDVLIACKEGALAIYKLQMAGSKNMPVRDFLSGHNKFIGAHLNNLI